MSNSVEHKVILVTGGARGLGAAFVKIFMDEKAKYVAILDVNEQLGRKLEKELNEKFALSRAKFIKCDVSDKDQLKNAYKKVVDEAGYIDVVINNAGVVNETLENFKHCIDINVIGVINSSLIALEIMRKDKSGHGGTIINISSTTALTGVINSSLIALEIMRKDNDGLGGTIFNISSIAALVNIPLLPIYSSTKSAVLQFSICLGSEPHFSRTGVRVMTMCFGGTDTAIVDSAKMSAIDDETLIDIKNMIDVTYKQRTSSAASALLYTYKNGLSASTWMSVDDKPAIEVTENVKEGYSVMGRGAYPSVQ